MIYDSFILAAVTDEISQTITRGKIERISQPTPCELIIRIYNNGAKHDLLFSCEPEEARMHLTSIRRENPPQPYAFCMLLRKYLDGGRIRLASTPLKFGERVFTLEMMSYDDKHFTLIAEIMGKHSNLILVNNNGTILGAAKHITRDVSRFREILPGIEYAPPPRQKGAHSPLGEFTPDNGEPMDPETARKWLSQTFTGISPLLAQETLARVPEPYTQASLWSSLTEILNSVKTKNYAPMIWRNEAGQTMGAYPIPLVSVPSEHQSRRDSISMALDNASTSIVRRDTDSRARGSLLTSLHKVRRLREKMLRDAIDGIENAKRADEYQQSGDLLLANQFAVTPGQESVELADYYLTEDDGSVPVRKIPLDPSLGVRDNAERFYKRARKARDGMAMLEERRERLLDEIALLNRAEIDLESAANEEQVEAIHERVAAVLYRGGVRPEAGSENGKPVAKQTPTFDGHKIRTFHSLDGWEILVGENATSNDYLTTKVASPSDIWLHVRAATSAHGIIRSQNRPGSVSAAALQHAAELVAARSEIKHSSLIPVDYTLRKYVRKPRKSAPGAVTYQNEKTLYVNGINA